MKKGREENLIPFKPGPDPRRNTKGKPKSFKQLRALVIEISGEQVADDQKITRIENMIREMLKSEQPADHALALKYGWGNVPDELDVTSGGEKITVKLVKPDAD